MGIAKEFHLDLSNSENNILDLSEYKGKRIKVSVELEDTCEDKLLGFFGSIKWEDKEAVQYQRNSRNDW